jgi:chaperonin cofactor prefoldin
MVALLFAATTSFVSCKDNVDDELVPVYAKLAQQKSDLESQIQNLQLQLAALQGLGTQVEQNTIAIQNLQNKLDLLQSELDTINNEISTLSASVDAIQAELDELETEVAGIELAILALQDQIDEINNRIDEMTKMITGIQINQTISDVTGTINLPGGMLRLNALAAFFGSNETGVEHFPNTDEDAVVIGEALTADEIAPAYAADQEYNFDPNNYITQDEGNAGMLLFTVNSYDPEAFDITEYTLSVQNSVGRTAPITFSQVKPSAYQIQWGAFKSGYVDTDADMNGDNTFFQARATIARKDLEASRFNLNKFFDLEEFKDDFNAAIEEVKAAKGKSAKVKAIALTAAQMLAKIYSGNMSGDNKNITNPTWSAQKLVLSKEVDGVTVKRQADDFDLAVSAVAPLSYNSFWKLEESAAKRVSMDAVEKAIAKVAEAIKQALPEISLGTVTITIPEMEADAENPYILVGPAGDVSHEVTIDEAVFEVIQEALEEGLTEIDLSEAIQGLDTNTLGNTVDNLADRANSWVEKFGNWIVNMLNNHAVTRAVAPIVLYNGANGINRLVTGTTVTPGVMQINITSATEELLVPAYAKYVALFKADGSCVQAKVYGGSEQRIDLNLTQAGEYKLVISCMDYYGFVCNKKYEITVE